MGIPYGSFEPIFILCDLLPPPLDPDLVHIWTNDVREDRNSRATATQIIARK